MKEDNKRFSLKNLKINSFHTALKELSKETIQGGGFDWTQDFGAFNFTLETDLSHLKTGISAEPKS